MNQPRHWSNQSPEWTVLLRSEITSGTCATLRTVAASNKRDHPTRSLYYCLFAPHTYIFVLRAHPVRGESYNQRNTTGEVAAVLTACSLTTITSPWVSMKHFDKDLYDKRNLNTPTIRMAAEGKLNELSFTFNYTVQKSCTCKSSAS